MYAHRFCDGIVVTSPKKTQVRLFAVLFERQSNLIEKQNVPLPIRRLVPKLSKKPKSGTYLW